MGNETIAMVRGCVVVLAVTASLGAGCGGGSSTPPRGDGGSGTCSGITGSYSASGSPQTGSTCDASLGTLSTTLSFAGDGSGYTAVFNVGGIDYACNGVVSGCRWDATCTGTGADGSSVRGMTTVTFTDTGFDGTLSEDFSGATNCHNQLSISGSRL